MDQPQGRIEAVIRGGETGVVVPDDDRRTIDGEPLKQARGVDFLFGGELAAFIVVAQFLADVELSLQNSAAPQTTDVGGRDMVALTDVRPATQFEHVARAADIADPRLSFGTLSLKRQRGGRV